MEARCQLGGVRYMMPTSKTVKENKALCRRRTNRQGKNRARGAGGKKKKRTRQSWNDDDDEDETGGNDEHDEHGDDKHS